MPLFYSFKDIKGLIDNDGLLFKSYRSKEEFTIDPPPVPIEGISKGIFHRFSGSIKVTSMVKAGYSKEGLESFISNQVQFNPLATAYELIPLSFVFDWIVNMGDFIVSHSSADFSQQSAMCTAVRTKLDQETYLVLDQQNVYQYTRGPNGCFPSAVTSDLRHTTVVFDILRREVTNNYERSLFSSADVSLSLNSSMMNWKRYVDASVLLYQPLKKLLTKISK
jgi:hypothetical protein